MQFLKTVFWVIVAVLAVMFSYNNWTPITIRLWSGLVLDTQLPVLVIGAFLVGLIPYWILHRTTRWRLTRKLDAAQRSLNDVQSAATTPVPPRTDPTMP